MEFTYNNITGLLDIKTDMIEWNGSRAERGLIAGALRRAIDAAIQSEGVVFSFNFDDPDLRATLQVTLYESDYVKTQVKDGRYTLGLRKDMPISSLQREVDTKVIEMLMFTCVEVRLRAALDAIPKGCAIAVSAKNGAVRVSFYNGKDVFFIDDDTHVAEQVDSALKFLTDKA
ncbi:MAG: hypothetical protein IPL86_16055 [Flavobacteriales bacterium]|nr:hypothetical protein [Flavobacteriales bacterium]